MRKYETVFILKPTLTEEETKNKINYVKEVLINNGAEIAVEKSIGTRDLAYEIKKQKRGFYQLFYFQAPNEAIAELERIYGISEEIIRFMNIKYENKVEIAHWDNFVAKYGKKDKTKTEIVEEKIEEVEKVEEVVEKKKEEEVETQKEVIENV